MPMATSTARGRKKTATTLIQIPDHLLAEIFLLLPATEDLARTSATCVSFRHLVTDGSFLRRLHVPPLLGFLDHEGFNPAVPHHPSAPAARALSLAADFTFSFLPSHCRWDIRDVRDGRVLLDRAPEKGEENPIFKELVVCDPLHRQYILLPPVPDKLATSVEDPIPVARWPWCDPFLAPLGEIEGAMEEGTAFKVILLPHCDTRLAAFVFSSSTKQWQAIGSMGWSDLLLLGKGVLSLSTAPSRVQILRALSQVQVLRPHYAYGCCYRNLLENSVNDELLVLELDTQRMELSIAGFPRGWVMREKVIVEAGEGRLGMIGINVEAPYDLCYTIRQNKGESSGHWQMEKIFSLDSGQHFILAATGRYLLLVRDKDRPTLGSSPEMPVWEYFSMDVRKLQLEKVCVKQIKQCADLFGVHIYTNFPPSLLSSRTI